MPTSSSASRGPIDLLHLGGIEAHVETVENICHHREGICPEGLFQRVRRDALRDERLRGRDDRDARLDTAEPTEKMGVLRRPLRVMTGVRLVRGEICEEDDRDRQVRVDVDAAAVLALVPVVGEPRLAGHELVADGLLGRHRGERMRTRAENVLQPRERGDERVPRNGVPLLPGDVPLAKGARTGQRGVHPAVRLREGARLGPRRPYAEAPFDLVGPAHLGTGQACRDALERLELTAQPPRAGRPRARRRRARPGAPPPRPGAVPWVGELLGRDLALPLGRPDVRVDEAVDVTTDAEAEPDVALGEVHPGTSEGQLRPRSGRLQDCPAEAGIERRIRS